MGKLPLSYGNDFSNDQYYWFLHVIQISTFGDVIMKLPAIFQKIKKEQTPEEKKKEAIFRTGTRQLKKLFQMGIGFPIIAMKM